MKRTSAILVEGYRKWKKTRQIPAGPKGKNVEKLAQNIQEAFLNNARKEKTFLTIYLMSGVATSYHHRRFR